MRIPFFKRYYLNPFDLMHEHCEKVKECAWKFQQAVECYFSQDCENFDILREEVIALESEADAIKRRIRGHLPKGTSLMVDKFELFQFLKEEDAVLDAVEEVLKWLSYRVDLVVPEALQKDFFLLVDAVIDPIEELVTLVAEARRYFDKPTEKQRKVVKEIIRNLRRQEHDADTAEDLIKKRVFAEYADGVMVYHTIHLAEVIGSIADHAENAGDMMRAMLAR